MFKNRYLTFLALLTAGLVAGTAGVSAQSEMDLLLFEKKAEGTQKANRGNPDAKTAAADIDISESLTDNLSKNNKKREKQYRITAEIQQAASEIPAKANPPMTANRKAG